ncbi:MAG: VOC family protein, partial [Planctomycetota bacterium]
KQLPLAKVRLYDGPQPPYPATRSQHTMCKLEHASVTVRDLDGVVKFLTTAFPSFRVRGDGQFEHGSWTQKWLHVGTDTDYIALYQAGPNSTGRPAAHSFTPSVNHLGFVVEDTDRIRQRLSAAGYKEGFIAEPHPYRKRLYFEDNEGFTWEFVEYLTDDPAKRNLYDGS